MGAGPDLLLELKIVWKIQGLITNIRLDASFHAWMDVRVFRNLAFGFW